MATAGKLITTALFSLLEIIIEGLVKCSLWIGNEMLDQTVLSFSDNFIASVLKLLPFFDEFNFGGVIFFAAYSIIILSTLITTAKNGANALLPDAQKESAVNIASRVVAASTLTLVMFGVDAISPNAIEGVGLKEGENIFMISNWLSGGIMGQIGEFFSRLFKLFQNSLNLSDLANRLDTVVPIIIKETSSTGKVSLKTNSLATSIGISAYFGYLILYASLIGSVLSAALAYIERIITFALTVTLGPIASALYVNKSTKDIFTEWLKSIFVQFFAIFYSYLMWLFFMTEMDNIISYETYISKFGDNPPSRLFLIALAIVFLNLVKNSEKLFNAFGVRTMPNTDSIRSVAGGMLALRTMARGAGMLGKDAVKGGYLAGGKVAGGINSVNNNLRHSGDLASSKTGNILKDTNGNIGMKMENIYGGENASLGNVSKGQVQGIYGTGASMRAKSNEAWTNINNAITQHDASNSNSPYIDNLNADTLNTALTGSPNGLVNGIKFDTDSHIRPFVHTISDANGEQIRCLAMPTVRADGSTNKFVDNGLVSIPLNGDVNREIFKNESISVEGSSTRQLSGLRYDGTSYQLDNAGHKMYHLTNSENTIRTPHFTGRVPDRNKNANHPN